MADIIIDGGPVSLDDMIHVFHGEARAVLADSAIAAMEHARAVVLAAVESRDHVYGVNTGFGALSGRHIDHDDATELQVNLLRSHAAGVGRPLPPPMVRGMLLLRARTLAQGHSGVRPVVALILLDLLNNDLLPVVPDRGSVGASGDLAPFAHLALPIIGEGELQKGDRVAPASELLAEHGLAALSLEPKEGLSLLNGTEGMLAWGFLGLHRMNRLAAAADVIAAMSVEALLGSARPFEARLHALRPHAGQLASAANLWRVL